MLQLGAVYDRLLMICKNSDDNKLFDLIMYICISIYKCSKALAKLFIKLSVYSENKKKTHLHTSHNSLSITVSKINIKTMHQLIDGEIMEEVY